MPGRTRAGCRVIYSNGCSYAVEIQLHTAILAEDFNAVLHCFLCPRSKRTMQSITQAPTMFNVYHTRHALGPALFDSSVTPPGPPSRHVVVLMASWPLSLSMPQSWVLYITAPCSRHTRPSMYRHNLHRAIVIVCLVDHVAARSEFSDLVLTLLQPLGTAVRPAMRDQTRR